MIIVFERITNLHELKYALERCYEATQEWQNDRHDPLKFDNLIDCVLKACAFEIDIKREALSIPNKKRLNFFSTVKDKLF